MFDHFGGKSIFRGVAQLGRALRSGRRGRGFKSRRLDHTNRFVKPIEACRAVSFFIYDVTCCYLIFNDVISVVLKDAMF